MSRESLEEAMNAFLKEQNQETQAAMLKEFSAYSFFVPGVFPQGTDLSDLRSKLPGNKIRLPQDKRPFPAVIRNNEGEYFLKEAGYKEEYIELVRKEKISFISVLNAEKIN